MMVLNNICVFFFFSSRRRHTRFDCDWSSDVCSSDLAWEELQQLARHGGIGAIHAEDDDIVMHMYEKLTREGRVGFENLAEVHNTLSEDLSFRRIIRLARSEERRVGKEGRWRGWP